MSTEKQILANQANGLLSSGPTTAAGKAIIAANAIKHGIFTRDVIISSAYFVEDREEYESMVNSLFACLSPQNQLENLLVEKIAVDFWRLRRVMRFESGSIAKHLENLFEDFYTFDKKNNEAIDQEIAYRTGCIEWNASYIPCLQREEVCFDHPLWKGKDIESDIIEDLRMVTKNIDELSRAQREWLHLASPTVGELRELLKKYDYPSGKEISAKLVELYEKQSIRLANEIKELEQKKLKNDASDTLNRMLAILPPETSADKVMKYDRSLQKSIFQNLFLLKKLQGRF